MNLLALGDSHLEALQFAASLDLLAVDKCAFCIVPGATAVGLRNPNSMTNALVEFRTAVLAQPRNCRILIHLGEVDCGFLIWWRHQKLGEPLEMQLEESLAAYRIFVMEMIACGFEHVCITGATLPTIRDGIDFGEVANLRSEVHAGLNERTRLTCQYNRRLRGIANELHCNFFDLADGLIDSVTGVVSDHFRNRNPSDHHLDKEKVAGMWAMECNRFIGAASE